MEKTASRRQDPYHYKNDSERKSDQNDKIFARTQKKNKRIVYRFVRLSRLGKAPFGRWSWQSELLLKYPLPVCVRGEPELAKGSPSPPSGLETFLTKLMWYKLLIS